MYIYQIKNINCFSGDTIECDVDYGMNLWRHNVWFSLHGIEAPNKNYKETRGDGVNSMIHLSHLLGTGKPVQIQTIKDKAEKHERYSAIIFVYGENINQRMVVDGFAKSVESSNYLPLPSDDSSP